MAKEETTESTTEENTAEAANTPPTEVIAAKNTLVALLDSADDGIRLQAAQALLSYPFMVPVAAP